MRTKWLLIALPLAILALLLQSSLWVPSYASQAKGNPRRLVTFIRSEGDAKLLNPILATDGTGIDLMHNNIFEALVDSDENMQLAPKLADRWEITEDAYLAVRTDRKLPNGTAVTALALLDAVTQAWKSGLLGAPGSSIQSIELVKSEQRPWTETVLPEGDRKADPIDVSLSIDVPERLKISLSKIEPEIFEQLKPVVGAAYFTGYPFEQQFKLKQPEQLALIRSKLPELLAVGEHNPILTFHLHPGVRWHDGRPFTGEDVKFTYEAVLNPKNASPRTSFFDSVKTFEVLDTLTVRATYRRLYSSAIIGWAAIEILPKHLLDAPALEREMNASHVKGDARKTFSLRNSSFNRRPIGTGPFRFAEWRQDQYIRLARNSDYWGTPPLFEDYYFRVIVDQLTQELEFGAGALDMYIALPHQAKRYREDARYQVLPSKEGYYSYIGYNLRRPLFQDIRVRRALGMAIDVSSIIKYVLDGEGKRATGPYYSSTPYNDPSVAPLPYDPKQALELLAEAGWHKNARGLLEKDGKLLEFTLTTNNGNVQRKAILAIAQEAWRKLGISCKVQAFEWTVFLNDVDHHNFDAVVLAWGGGEIDPDKFSIWHSSQTNPYELNHAGYKSARADELITKIQHTYDPAELVKLTHQFHRIIAEDQPYTFLYEPSRPYVFDKRIVKVEHGADGTELLGKAAASPSGDALFFMKQWRKLASAPSFAN